MEKIVCRVLKVAQIEAHVYLVKLRLPVGKAPAFFAGQYLSLELPQRTTPAFFSIASRPGLRTLELHIQADPHLESPLEVVQFLRTQLEVPITLPFGRACLQEKPNKPLILLAAGTGFAQMKSIVEYLHAQRFKLPIALYWGVRKPEDMYQQGLVAAWERQHQNFRFIPIVATSKDSRTTEYHGQMRDQVLAEQPDIGNCLVFVSGSPRLVSTLWHALAEAGLPKQQFLSDVLESKPL